VTQHLRFWYAALGEALRQRPHVIVSANFFTTFIGWLASRLTGASLVYDAHELIIPIPNERMSRREYLWYQMERFSARYANLIVAANQERAELMQRHYNLANTPVVVRNIPSVNHGTLDRSVIMAIYPALVRRSADEFLILYQGDISLSRGIDKFVLSLAHLPAQYRMIVVGDGPDLERLKAIGQAFAGEGRFDTLGAIENRLLPAIAAEADVGIVTYPFEGMNNIYCSPNKIYEYAQAGLPVVSTDQPPLRSMVVSYEIGVLVSRIDTPEAIAAAIRGVVENKTKYTRSLAHFLRDHRWEDEASRLQLALAEVVDRVCDR